jgi:hypothetical protein
MKMEYVLIESEYASQLEKLVNANIKEGWQPLGGVAISTVFESVENTRKGYMENSTTTTYVQAITRTKL